APYDTGDDAPIASYVGSFGVRHPRTFCQRTEVKRIHCGHWSCSHREYVSQDAANTGGGALIRLAERWGIVGFGLEPGREPSAPVDYAGILSWPLQDKLARSWKPAKMYPRRFVRTMF